MDSSIEFFNSVYKRIDRDAHLFGKLGNGVCFIDFGLGFLIAFDASCNDRFVDHAGINNDEYAVFFD